MSILWRLTTVDHKSVLEMQSSVYDVRQVVCCDWEVLACIQGLKTNRVSPESLKILLTIYRSGHDTESEPRCETLPLRFQLRVKFMRFYRVIVTNTFPSSLYRKSLAFNTLAAIMQ